VAVFNIKEAVRLYSQEKLGAKLIAKRLNTTHKVVIKYLKRAGVYNPGSIPRRSGNTLSQEKIEGRIIADAQSKAWKMEWRGVVEDYTKKWCSYQKALEKQNQKYRSMSEEQRKQFNREMNLRYRNARLLRTKMWRNSDKGRNWMNLWHKNRLKNDPAWKIRCTTYRRISEAMKGNYTAKTQCSEYYVGCSWAELRDHLQRQFKRGMNWNNYGKVWHIDHIIPCASFNLTKDSELRRCFHFTNLQPLNAVENMSKGARIVTCQPSLLL